MNTLSYAIPKGRFDKKNKFMVRSTMTGSCSVRGRLLRQPYRKIVHVNGETASLIFFIRDSTKRWIPWTGTDYMPCGFFSFPKLPTFIKRHVDPEILQDYATERAMGNYKKYPFGLYFENGELISMP